MSIKARGQYIEALARKYGWTRGAELGIWYGQTYFHLLDALPGLTLIGVDAWLPPAPASSHHQDQAANRREVRQRAAGYGDRAQILDMTTAQASAQVPDASLDFVFIDADHSYAGCRADILAWRPKLKADGWIIGHDFLWPGVNQAVRELLMPVNCPVAATDETWARPAILPRGAVTICCLKAGTKYGPDYVNRLHSMVQRHVHLEPYDFVCFTDDPTGIDPWIRTAPPPYAAPGWWGKLGLYLPEIPGIQTERLLFLDLDVVITGPLDPLIQYKTDFAMAKDWPTGAWPAPDPRDRDGNSSVVLVRIGAVRQIWDRYLREGQPQRSPGDGDQEWINRTFPGLVDLLPETLVQSYKLHHLQDARPACSVVMFHGIPKPPDCGGWVKEDWR